MSDPVGLREHRVAVPGAVLVARCTGAGLPVLALHGGMGLSSDYLEAPLLPLVSAGVELVLLDQRGSGRSRPADLTGVSLDTWADDAVAVLDALGHRRAVLLGHSYGGFVALQTALRHPSRVAGLVLVGSGARLDHWEQVHEGLARRRASVEQRRGFTEPPFVDDAEFAAWLRAALPLYLAPDSPAETLVAATLRDVSPDAAAVRHSGALLASYDLTPELPRIKAPALVVTGDHDIVMGPAAQALRDGLPRATEARFPDSGHFPFVEESDRFRGVVTSWLRSELGQPVGRDWEAPVSRRRSGRRRRAGSVRAGEVCAAAG